MSKLWTYTLALALLAAPLGAQTLDGEVAEELTSACGSLKYSRAHHDALAKQREEQRKADEARRFNGVRVRGTDVALEVERLNAGLEWHRTQSVGLAAAEREGKPLLWIRALGEVDGYL